MRGHGPALGSFLYSPCLTFFFRPAGHDVALDGSGSGAAVQSARGILLFLGRFSYYPWTHCILFLGGVWPEEVCYGFSEVALPLGSQRRFSFSLSFLIIPW